ncbi:MAG: lipase [Leptolyngbya sp. DLM2.Bin15]|nr:MAG: lipase [Leptolyngbya sp. DLM2.Bin15]
MYQFQLGAHTQPGECIGLVGNTPELGAWDPAHCIRLQTSRDRYPIWWTDLPIQPGDRSQLEYKYIRLHPDGQVEWESWGANRWVPIEPIAGADADTWVVDDGVFGYVQPYPFSYPLVPIREPAPSSTGLKVVVVGSSVAAGHKAWRLQGWAQQLAQTMQQRGQVWVNRSEVGASVTRTIARFASVVGPERPDVVILALSLGNEGFAHCLPEERSLLQQRFEHGLKRLIGMVRALGAQPVLGDVYAHNDYTSDHAAYLWETHRRMMTWGVPVLNWLEAIADGQGRWKPGISYDPAHPNTLGHQGMYEAALAVLDQQFLGSDRLPEVDQPTFRDAAGFELSVSPDGQAITIRNASPYDYSLTPDWTSLHTALGQAPLIPGLYLTTQPQAGQMPYLWVQQDGAIASSMVVPPGCCVTYRAAYTESPDHTNLLFYDGQLGILKQDDQHLWIMNESEYEFNIHPMWQAVRRSLRAMPPGVYSDPLEPDAPFRTLMIGPDGLESRAKILPRSAILFRYQCGLSDISRVAILPLGDRCAVRMMLYKMGYDGPAFPFDLTRTTLISDVADMIENRFTDMWKPDLLHYSPSAGRIYHTKWTGLSFAHEVEESDRPLEDMTPIYERMRRRYTSRSDRFWYTLNHCDKVLFIRTGWADRDGVLDLVQKLEAQCQGKPFHLLLLSPQRSSEFSDMPHVLHYSQEFNPDRMYDDLDHWLDRTEILRTILESLGVSSKNLFWCPPTVPSLQ